MPPKRRRRFHGLYYHSSPPKVLGMNGQMVNGSKPNARDDVFVVKPSNIRIWIHEKDIGKLTKVLWAGHGNRLRSEASTNPKVKKFLEAVPYVMNVVKDVHQAVIDNNLEVLQSKLEPPVPTSLVTTKDANGLNVIHKAAGLGHTMILEYLLGIWPEGAMETDMTGKTALHWAASAKNNLRCYSLLTQAGCDEDALDYKMKTPAYYKQKANDVEKALLTVVPDAPRVSQMSNLDWSALSTEGNDLIKRSESIAHLRRTSDYEENELNSRSAPVLETNIESISEPDFDEGLTNGLNELSETIEPDLLMIDENANDHGMSSKETTPIASRSSSPPASPTPINGMDDNENDAENEINNNDGDDDHEFIDIKGAGDMNGDVIKDAENVYALNGNAAKEEKSGDGLRDKIDGGHGDGPMIVDMKIIGDGDKIDISREENERKFEMNIEENKEIENFDENELEIIQRRVNGITEEELKEETDLDEDAIENNDEGFIENVDFKNALEIDENDADIEVFDQSSNANATDDELNEDGNEAIEKEIDHGKTDNELDEVDSATNDEKFDSEVDNFSSNQEDDEGEQVQVNDAEMEQVDEDLKKVNEDGNESVEEKEANEENGETQSKDDVEAKNETEAEEENEEKDENEEKNENEGMEEKEKMEENEEMEFKVEQKENEGKVNETEDEKNCDSDGNNFENMKRVPNNDTVEIDDEGESLNEPKGKAKDSEIDDDDDEQDLSRQLSKFEGIPNDLVTDETTEIDENHNSFKLENGDSRESPSPSLAIEGFIHEESHEGQVESQTEASYETEDKKLQEILNVGDMEQLAIMVLNGDGKKLLNLKSRLPEIQAFLINVPAYMGKIRRVHEAARIGSLRELQAALDRRKFAIAKDEISPEGATPLHVAVIFGHSDIVRYLAGRFPETMSSVDDNGRTALHYAAVIKDNGHFFNLLSHLGSNFNAKDKLENTPEFYLNHDKSMDILSHRQLLMKFDAEGLDEEMLSDQGREVNHTLEIPLFKTEQGRYLANSLGEPLIKGLTEIADKRPSDPVAYLATFLQNFVHTRNGRMTGDTSSTAVISNDAEPSGDLTSNNQIQKDDEFSSPETTPQAEDRDEHGQSMLHFACARGHGRNGLLNLIEESQINVTYRDELYRTARDVSLQASQPGNAKEIDRFILQQAVVGDVKPFDEMILAGYDHILDISDDNDNSIIDVVDSRGHDKLSNFLRGAMQFEELREGLHRAIREGNFEKVQELTALPIASRLIRAKNYYGRTSLHIAVLKEVEEIVEYLVNTCPDVLKTGDNLERTPLHYAMGVNSVEGISRILIRKGAKRTAKDLKGRQPSYYFMNKAEISRLQEEEEEDR